MTNLRRLSLFRLFLLLSAFQLFNVSAFSQSITSAEAKDNVGQEKTVTGILKKISTVGKLTILDIDGVFPNAPFSAVIFGDKLPSFDQATLDSYKDKSVAITGKIVLHKDRPQIALNAPTQITLADGSAPAPAPATPTEPATATSPTPAAPPETAPSTPTTDNQQPTTKSPPATLADKKNLLVNGNFNKGKKGWEMPADAEVLTEGESQVLKVKLIASDRVYIKQPLEIKIPKGTTHFEISFDAKIAEGTNLVDGITVRLGQSFKESTYKKFKDPTTKSQTFKWPRTGDLASTENLIFTVEVDQGEGNVIIDNIQLIPVN